MLLHIGKSPLSLQPLELQRLALALLLALQGLDGTLDIRDERRQAARILLAQCRPAAQGNQHVAELAELRLVLRQQRTVAPGLIRHAGKALAELSVRRAHALHRTVKVVELTLQPLEPHVAHGDLLLEVARERVHLQAHAGDRLEEIALSLLDVPQALIQPTHAPYVSLHRGDGLRAGAVGAEELLHLPSETLDLRLRPLPFLVQPLHEPQKLLVVDLGCLHRLTPPHRHRV